MKNTIKVKRLTGLEVNIINTEHIVFVKFYLFIIIKRILLCLNIASNRERTYELLAF